EVGENDLPRAHQRPFLGQRLLDFDDEVRLAPDLFGIGNDVGAVAGILFVANAAALSGAGLDEHAVARPRQLFDPHRDHGYAVLVRLNFFRHADDHTASWRRGTVHSETSGRA